MNIYDEESQRLVRKVLTFERERVSDLEIPDVSIFVFLSCPLTWQLNLSPRRDTRSRQELLERTQLAEAGMRGEEEENVTVSQGYDLVTRHGESLSRQGN